MNSDAIPESEKTSNGFKEVTEMTVKNKQPSTLPLDEPTEK